MAWHSIHVHYHAGDLDRLILDAVRPLFGSWGGEVAACYFVRHWLRGPHLRLNVRTSPNTFRRVIRPVAEEIVGGFLVAHPSRTTADPRELLSSHQRLAAMELEDGPLLPWHPDNSLRVEPYDGRVRVLGSEAAADLLASFLAASTDLTFDLLDHLRAGGRRARLGFDLMLATAHGLSGVGITQGYGSFRSHAEAFLCAWPEGRGRREPWDRHYQAHRPALVRRVGEVVDTVDGGTAAVPFVADWVAVLGRYLARGRELLAASAMTMDPPPPDTPLQPEATTLADVSPFHRAAERSPGYREVRDSLWFAGYRLALNYCYLHLTRLGLTPGERFLLCHLAASAVEDRYGLPPLPRGGS